MRASLPTTLLCFVLLLVSPIGTSYADSKLITNESFDFAGYRNWDPSIAAGGKFSMVDRGTGKAVKIERKSIQGDNFTQLRYRVPIDIAKGRHLRVEALVKGDQIEIGKKSFYGGHLDFEMSTPEGPVYESAPFLIGTFDWSETAFECDVPIDVKTIDLRIGLQGAKGSIFYDDVRVFVIN